MTVVNEKMMELGNKSSIIRENFEYANKRASQIGRENVFDFSLGNPSVPTPQKFNSTLVDLLNNSDSVKLHGYTSAAGDLSTRQAIADGINKKYNAGVCASDIYLTCGAAASLTVSLNALSCKDDEFIAFAPFFPEYRVFVESTGAKLKVVKPHLPDFQIDFDSFKQAITPNTKAVIINSPNNPSGVVYSKETITKLCDILREYSEKYSKPIYLITDEPYRELVYDDSIEVPYLINCYDNTIVCYSFSKSLSLPGERFGYIIVSSKAQNSKDIYAAVCGAGRALGYVCAPSMMQAAIKSCLDMTSDIEVYKTNRDLLYNALTSFGYSCVHPDGAFYLFVKSPIDDANEFCMKAREYELMLVPSDNFGCTGYIRIAYCVSTDMIKRSLPAFEKLLKENYLATEGING